MAERRQWKLLTDSKLEPAAKAGTIVYDPKGYDYGLASDDTRMTGREHRSVTLNADGSYPTFTHECALMEPTNA